MSRSIALPFSDVCHHRSFSWGLLQMPLLLLVVASMVCLHSCSAEGVSVAGKIVYYDGKLVSGLSNRKLIRFRRDSADGDAVETLNTSSNGTINSGGNATTITTLPSNTTTLPTVTTLPSNTTTVSNSSSMPTVTNTSNTVENATSNPMSSTTKAPAPTSTATLPPINNVTPTINDSTTTTSPPTTTITIETEDRQYYLIDYSKTPAEGRSYWRNIDGNKRTHTALDGRTKALQVRIPYNFTFYGHDVDHITMAVGGFLYMSPFLHQYISATQYIAPLMADFNSSIDDGAVYYSLQSDALIVEWRKVRLHTQPDAGAFTFQVQLYRDDGKIVFAYKDIPIPVRNISTEAHSVNVGIADAYYYDFGFVRTIHEYHNIAIETDRVVTDAAVIFTHKQTCNVQKDCNSCHNVDLEDFTCLWCEDVKRCSDKKDRGRQEWFTNFCPFHDGDGKQAIEKEKCKDTTTATTTPPSTTVPSAVAVGKQEAADTAKHPGRTAGIVIAVILLIIVASLVILYVYSYNHPSSIPGQFLIKYRPSQMCSKCTTGGNKAETYTVNSQVLINEAYEG